MTTVIASQWKNAVNGNYGLAANWTPAGVPNDTPTVEYDVSIGGSYTSGAAAFTVTSGANETVGSLDVEANATLSIKAGLFDVASNVSAYSEADNLGTLDVAAGATLRFGAAGRSSANADEFENDGTASVAGVLSIADASFNLLGPGKLKLSGSILGADTGAVASFTNRASTIQGSGSIGNGSGLQFINVSGGVVDASGGLLTLNTGANLITNAGLIETTGSGDLVIDSDLQNDGQLKATGGGWIKLENSQVDGGGATSIGSGATLFLDNSQFSYAGSLSLAANGYIRTMAGDTTGIGANNAYAGDAIQCGNIQDAGRIVVTDNSTLNMNAAIYGAGALVMAGGADATKLELFGNGLGVNNAGGLVMSDSANNAIVSNGAAVSLFNYTSVSGAGTIGDGLVTTINHEGATITANGDAALVLVGYTGPIVQGQEYSNYNAGTIRNIGAGGLVLSGGGLVNSGIVYENGAGALTLDDDAINQGGGIVRAYKGSIVLENNSLIYNQNYVEIDAGASLTTTAGDAFDGIGANMFDYGALDVVAGSTLGAYDHWDITGVINLGGAAGGATLSEFDDSYWELFGGGTLKMLNGVDAINSVGPGAYFEDRLKLIVGGGAVGDANMSVNIESGATIDATLASGMTLDAEIDPGAGVYGLNNSGILQSDSSGGLTIATDIYSPGQLIANNGAKIVAEGDVLGYGQTHINGTGSVEFGGQAQNDVYFGAAVGGDLILDSSHAFTGAVYGFAAGDAIDLRDFAHVAGSTGVDGTASSISALNAHLELTNGTADSASLWLQGNYTAAYMSAHHLAFEAVSDGSLIAGTQSTGTLLRLVSTH